MSPLTLFCHLFIYCLHSLVIVLMCPLSTLTSHCLRTHCNLVPICQAQRNSALKDHWGCPRSKTLLLAILLDFPLILETIGHLLFLETLSSMTLITLMYLPRFLYHKSDRSFSFHFTRLTAP